MVKWFCIFITAVSCTYMWYCNMYQTYKCTACVRGQNKTFLNVHVVKLQKDIKFLLHCIMSCNTKLWWSLPLFFFSSHLESWHKFRLFWAISRVTGCGHAGNQPIKSHNWVIWVQHWFHPLPTLILSPNVWNSPAHPRGWAQKDLWVRHRLRCNRRGPERSGC